MKKLTIAFFCMASLACNGLHAQTVESKKCKTCGKPLKECPYKGLHTSKTAPKQAPIPTLTPKPDSPTKEPELEKPTYVRMDGNDIVFSIDGQEFRYIMVYVSGGSYMMGCTSEQGNDCDDNEKPARRVSLNSFYIGQTEVTQALWNAVMGVRTKYRENNTFPKENVTYYEVEDFISKLNSITGKQFRLPSEGEWEFAARGGNNSKGYKYSGSDNIESVAWYKGNCGGYIYHCTHPVAQKMANELELYDMSGNVNEWCNKPSNWKYVAIRGGSCASDDKRCRVSRRYISHPGTHVDGLGFRLTLSSN